jgi:hypothetical protein
MFQQQSVVAALLQQVSRLRLLRNLVLQSEHNYVVLLPEKTQTKTNTVVKG